MRAGVRSEVLNGLRHINVRYEANARGTMDRSRASGRQTVAAGYAHACRVVDGRAFVWGTNQIAYVVDDNFGAMAPGIGECGFFK